ncbi:1-phosphofructokinase family hexose kinase [Microbacterium sp. P07]|uniref:1-phosphofructokinase family hexose kinase n=1 Tax=Microbacterium sp. P07 TaxID=3366952 RepID=UPI003744D220
MIVTLTANPSIDRALALDASLVPGEVQPARAAREDAGGKGVNVARVVAAAGADTLAVVPVSDDDPFNDLLRATGIPIRTVPSAGRVRANLTVTDPDGVTTKINLPGPVLDEQGAFAIIDAVVAACADARWLVLAGSLPPRAGADFYTRVIGAVRETWGSAAPRIAVDASGPALAAVVRDALPDLIKPNDEELAALVGEDPSADTDLVAEAARRSQTVVPARAAAALVTLGASGALLVTGGGVLRAVAPRIAVASTVGAGDSSLAGYLLADIAGRTPAECLAQAVAYGAAAAMLPGTQAPTPEDLPPEAIAVSSFSSSF